MLISAILMISCLLTAETIFNETMGAAATITEIPDYTGWYNYGSVNYTGTADARSTWNSAGHYPGASGAGNIYFVGGENDYFQISGINTSGYRNIRLSLALYKSNTNSTTGNAENGSNFNISYSVDSGISWRRLPISLPTGTGTRDIYYWRELAEYLPATDNLTLRFTNIGTTEPVHFRMDDVTLTGDKDLILSETIGIGAANTEIGAFTGWSNSSPIVFSGNGYVRNDLPSTNKYTGATGGGNVLLNSGHFFQISGINTVGYSLPVLSVGVMKASAAENGSRLLMTYSTDGINWSTPQPCYTSASGTNLWYRKHFSGIPVAANLYLKFSNTSTVGGSFRIDDIGLFSSLNAPVVGFPASSSLSSISATLSANIIRLGGANVSQRGFYYSTTNNFADGAGTIITEAVSMSQPGEYSLTTGVLLPNTVYYYKAFATSASGTNYSGQQSFTTLATGVLPATLTVNPTGSGIFNYTSLLEAVNALNVGILGTSGITIKVAAGITEQISAPIVISNTGTSTKPIQIIKDPSTSGANPLITRTDAGSISTSVAGGNGDCFIRIDGSDYLTIDGIDLSANNEGIEYGYLTNKPNATNGCQILTIKNCTITMTKGNSPYVTGIYIGNGTNSTSDASGVTVTAASGKNMNVTITGNIIQNVHTGILMRGSSASSYWDSDFGIGSSGAGNQILNFGGNISTHSHGICFINVINPTVAYNTIDNTGEGGTPHTANLSGVSFEAVSGAVSANNNSIKLACDTQEPSIRVLWINNPNTCISETYLNNSFTAGTLNNVESCKLIVAINQTPTRTVTGNITSGYFYLTGNVLFCIGYEGMNESTPNMVHTISNNTFSNFVAESNTYITGIHSYLFGETTNLQISGNNISNFSSAVGRISGIIVASTGTCSISNNSISNFTGSGLIYGINYYGKTINVNNNTISNLSNLSTTEGVAIKGIYQEFATTANCYNNVISGLSSAKQDYWVSGIEIDDGTTTKIYNNMIHSLYAVGNMGTVVSGILIKAGTSTEISYNSVYLDAFGRTAALTLWLNTPSTIRNNIFVNKSNPGIYGRTVAIEKHSNGNMNLGSSTNKNIYYAGIPDAQRLIASLGSVDYPTLAGYKAAVSTVDQGSFTQDVPFMSTSGTYDLHINPSIATYAQNQGSPISGITTDIDGQTRHSTTPDIGADEGNFTIAPTCVAPSAQAIALSLTPTSTAIYGTITPSSAPAYMVLFHTAATATMAPVNGIDYALGASLGNATIISIGNATTFSATGLSVQTQYYFTVYAYNDFGFGAPLYRTIAPLSQGIMTLPVPPAIPRDFKAFAATHTSIEFYTFANSSGSNIMIAWAPNQTFGTPIGMYSVGSPIAGGGTVMYMGPASGIPNHTELSLSTTYYYKAWSYETVEGTVYGSYSSGITASAKTPGSPLLGVKSVNPMGSGDNNYLSLSQAIADLNDSWTGPGGVIFNVVAGYTESITAPLTITATGFADSPITIQKDPSTSGANPIITRNDDGIVPPSNFGGSGDSIIRIEGSDYITFDGIDVNSGNSGIDFGYYAHKVSGTNGCHYVRIKNCTINMTKLPAFSNTGNVIGIFISYNTKLSFPNGVTVTAQTGANSNIIIEGVTVRNTNYGIILAGLYDPGFPDKDFTIGSEANPNVIQDFQGSTGIYVLNINNISICHNTIENSGAWNIDNPGNLQGILFNRSYGDIEVSYNHITLATSGTYSSVKWIHFYGGSTNSESIIGNTFAGGAFTSFNDSAYIYGAQETQLRTISGNHSSGMLNLQSGSRGFYGYFVDFFGRPTAEIFTNNNFSNISVSGATKLYGIFSRTHQPSSYSGNRFENLSAETGVLSGIEVWAEGPIQVNNNTICNLTSGGNIHGIMVGGIPTEVSNNLIYNFNATSPAAIVRGIRVSSSGSVAHNNMVHSLFALGTESTPSSPTVAGIEGNDDSKIYHNSVYLSGSGSGAGFSTAAVHVTHNVSICRNNIFINKSTPGSAGRSVARWGQYPGIVAGTNNNIYYAGIPGPRNLISYQSSNSYQTLEEYKLGFAPIDSQSFTEDVPFISSSGNIDLHINPLVPTFVESGGVFIEGYATDFDGDTRNSSTPDIGADEGDLIRDGVPPNPASEPSPADLATEQLTDVTLSWSRSTGGAAPTSYNVYFGTTNPPALIGNQEATTFSPGNLSYNQSYYWKIDPANSYGLASTANTLPVWSFTTHNPLPEAAVLVSPASGATGIAVNPSLNWSAGTGFAPLGYKLYLGTDNPPTNVINGTDLGDVTSYAYSSGRNGESIGSNNASAKASPSLSRTELDAILSRNSLDYNTTYYWKVVPYTLAGSAGNNAVWSFSTELAPVPNVAINPLPADMSINQSITPSISWQANPEGTVPDSYNVYFGTTNPPPLIDSQTGTSYSPGALAYSTTHYWMIDPHSSRGYSSSAHTLPVWSFTTIPNPYPTPAVVVNPLSGATDVALQPTLQWNAGAGALPTGYRLALGTDNPPTNLLSGINLGNALSYQTPELAASTTFYWQVIPYTAAGDAAGNAVWSFTTALPPLPLVAIDPVPEDLATSVPTNIELSWSPNPEGTVPIGYNVYFGTTYPPELIGNQTSTSYDPGVLSQGTTYYWQVDPQSAQGYCSQEYALPVWSFTTEYSFYPSQAIVVSPANGSTIQDTGSSLSWSAGAGAIPTGYRISLGTNYPPTNLLNSLDLGNTTTCNPAGLLTGTTYYWQVQAYNSLGDAPPATVWSFSIAAQSVSIGTGNGTNRSPFGTAYGYERDATLYTAAEIGNLGQPISSLAWYATRSVTTNTPIKVYLKATSATVLPSVNWANTISGATLVYNSTVSSIAANAWMNLSLSPAFTLAPGSNLMVLIETNFGGSGSGNSFGGGFLNTNYSPVNSLHKYWFSNTSPPTTLGSYDILRANIRISSSSTVVELPSPAVVIAPLNGATNEALTSTLNWASGGGNVTGYRLYLGTDGNGSSTPTNMIYGLDLGNTLSYTPPSSFAYTTTYYWKVIPYNGGGAATGGSNWRFTTQSEPIPSLDAPTNLVVTLIDGTLSLSWDSVPNAAGYLVFSSDDPNSVEWGTPRATTTSTSFAEAVSQSKRFYKIVATSIAP
jgi:hypothetical protein